MKLKIGLLFLAITLSRIELQAMMDIMELEHKVQESMKDVGWVKDSIQGHDKAIFLGEQKLYDHQKELETTKTKIENLESEIQKEKIKHGSIYHLLSPTKNEKDLESNIFLKKSVENNVSQQQKLLAELIATIKEKKKELKGLLEASVIPLVKNYIKSIQEDINELMNSLERSEASRKDAEDEIMNYNDDPNYHAPNPWGPQSKEEVEQTLSMQKMMLEHMPDRLKTQEAKLFDSQKLLAELTLELNGTENDEGEKLKELEEEKLQAQLLKKEQKQKLKAAEKEKLETQINTLEPQKLTLEGAVLSDKNDRDTIQTQINQLNFDKNTLQSNHPHAAEIKEEIELNLKLLIKNLENANNKLSANQQALDKVMAELNTAKEALKSLNEKDGGENSLKAMLVMLQKKLSQLKKSHAELAKNITTLQTSLNAGGI